MNCGFLTLAVLTGAACLSAAVASERPRAGVVPDATSVEESVPRPAVAQVGIEFKVDPVLTRATHLGERWVARDTYQTTRQTGKKATLEARAIGLDRRGRLIEKRLPSVWTVDDPDMVSVAPGRNDQVMLTIHRAGTTSVRVTFRDLSRLLIIKSIYEAQHDTTQVEVTTVNSSADAARLAGSASVSKFFTVGGGLAVQSSDLREFFQVAPSLHVQ